MNQARFSTRWVLIAALAAGCGRSAPPAAPVSAPALPPAPPRTAAFIDVDRSPLGALLATKLAAEAKPTWLEREHIDRLLQEQKLQAAFTPEGGAHRAELGRLLKADLLVLLRTLEATDGSKEKRVNLVVCETRGGLRLANRTLLPGKDRAADARELAAAVHESITRYETPPEAVFAVPPFVSNDLTYEFDYLKAAYARLVEQQLLERKGVLVVELAEAQALANEVRLTDGARLERPSPQYLLGEYRNEKQGERRRTSITVKRLHTDRRVESVAEVDLPPEEVPERLRRLVGKLIDRKAEPPRLDTAAEVKQLAARAAVFQRLGDWDEALALIEASLLLRPDQPEMHREAAIVCGKITRRDWSPGIKGLKESRYALACAHRGLEHLETFLRTAGKHPDRQRPYTETFVYGLPLTYLRIRPPRLAELKEVHAQFLKEEDETLLRLVRLRAREGFGDEDRYLSLVTHGLPRREYFALILKTIVELQDVPERPGRNRTIRLALGWYSVDVLDSAEGRDFLERLAAVPSKKVQAAAHELQDSLEARVAIKARTAPPRPGPAVFPDGPLEVAFLPVELDRGFRGCVPAGPGVDCVWTGNALFLMKQKGVLKPVWSGGAHFKHVCYDGRYIWAPVHPQRQTPRLLVIDPQSERVWEFTKEDGLPVAAENLPAKTYTQQTLAAAPLGSGKVCLAGSFGRAWLAIATFDGSAKKVNVFHEARDVHNLLDKEQWKSTRVAFHPSYMFVLSDRPDGTGRAEQRVLVGRADPNAAGQPLCRHPLLIDPEKLSVEVVPEERSEAPLQAFDRHNGAAYVIGPPRWNKQHIVRLGFPGRAAETIVADVPQGWVVFHDGVLSIVGKEWWTVDLAGKKVQRAAAQPPWDFEYHSTALAGDVLQGVYHSSHYGLLVLKHHYQKTPRPFFELVTYQVVFRKRTKDPAP